MKCEARVKVGPGILGFCWNLALFSKRALGEGRVIGSLTNITSRVALSKSLHQSWTFLDVFVFTISRGGKVHTVIA